jgi:hypothetical protein
MENIPTSINYNAKCKFQGNFIIERLYCIEKNMGILTTDLPISEIKANFRFLQYIPKTKNTIPQ